MVFYSKLNLDMTPPSLEDYTPSLGESAAAARDEAWATNPSASLYNMVEMYRATGPRATKEYVDPISGVAYRFEPERNPDALSVEEQQIKIRDAGLEGYLTPQEGYTQWALNILFARKKAELSNQFISSRSPASHFPVTLGAGLAASVVDPINIASAFVPVVGESRALSLLGQAKGPTGRALTRAKIGAMEGAVGGALVEPLIYSGQNAVQADYDMIDSLLNVGFGAVMGATLQPLAGGVGDWLRARRGQRQPWQIAPDTDESRALMLQFRDSIRDARIAMGVDAARAAEEGAADAVLFDLRARRASYDFNRPVKEYYDRWMPEVQAALSPLSESRNLYGNELASRFADMPMIEADSTQWFGEGREIPVSEEVEIPGQRKMLRNAVKTWAKERFSEGTPVVNADTGWQVQVTPKGIENSLSHGFDETLARSVPFIPQIIEGGVHVDSIRKTPQLLSHIFANKIRLDGQDYVIGFVLREDVNGNRFYDHELTEIINPDWLAPGHPSNEGPSEEGSSGHRTNRGDVMNILRERLGVNDGTGRILFQFIDPARVQATPGVQDVVPVLRRIFHMNTMELDDSKATVTVPREIGMSGPLTDIYQHDALYELYPELRDVRYEVVPEDRLPGNLAGYSPKNGIIYITTDSEVTPSVIAHEVQHAIQDVDERFDFGLSEEASQEVYSQVEQELKDKLPIERARALAARIQYLSQAHEIQAFDTQNRFELTAEERAKYAPNNPSTYYQRQTGDFSPSEGDAIPRARVTFDATPDGRAVIEFFNAADASSMPHELYHIFRREMAESAARPDAPQRVREDWARIEEFVGAEPGQTWTREMEEKFARAGERFLLEGKAPSPALQSVFERLRQWFMEIYANADAAGLHISPAMREVFKNMFSVPAEEADASFRYAVGDLATREIEREFAGDDARFDAAVQEGDMETVGALAQDAEMNLNETLTIAAQSEPETAGMISEQYAPELAMADVDIVKARQMRDVLREVVACEMGR